MNMNKARSILQYAFRRTMSSAKSVTTRKQEIINLTEKVLTSIRDADFDKYMKYTDCNMTCFEPPACGNLVEGMDFHKFYFDNVMPKNKNVIKMTIINPHVHLLGEDGACIVYVRLSQFIDKDGIPCTRMSEESRVWNKKDGQWKIVHLHHSGFIYSPK